MDSDKEQLIRQQASLAHRLTMPLSASNSTNDAYDIAIDGFDECDLVRSRETLIRKRISQTQGLLPRTAELLGSRFIPLFRHYAERHHLHGANAILHDAIQFSKWLWSRLSCKMKTGSTLPQGHGSNEIDAMPWAADLALWESMRLQSLTKPLCLHVVRLEYDIANWRDSSIEPTKKRSRWCVLRCYQFTRIFRLL